MPPRTVKRGAGSAGPKRTTRGTRRAQKAQDPPSDEVAVVAAAAAAVVEAKEALKVEEEVPALVVEEEVKVEEKPVVVVEQQCSFVEHRNYKIVYRRYASLFFLVGVDNDENELAILEFIHLLVETMDRHFGNVCELDIMFHLEKAHFMLEEMVMNGCIVETSKTNILQPIQLMEKSS